MVLHYMPKAVYVKIDDSDEVFLKADLRGVLAITPQARGGRAASDGSSRTQAAVAHKVP